jgi:hypothetical protein
MATYIRTITDQYNFNIVIDVTDNEVFVNTTGFDWINIGNLTAKNGDFFYDNKIIACDTDDYKIIEALLFEKVEAENIALREAENTRRLQEEKELADAIASAEAEAEAIAAAERAASLSEKPSIIPENERALPPNFEEILDTLPIPTVINYLEEFKDLEITIDVLKEWAAKNKEMQKFAEALQTATMDGKKVIFNPPYTRLLGTVNEETLTWMYSPHPDIEHYRSHTQLQQEQLELFLTKIKSDLGLV